MRLPRSRCAEPAAQISAPTADRRFVWGIRSVDDLILRDRGAERLYALHDAMSVTAVINTGGAVQERYGYDGFGGVRYMTSAFGSRGSSSYDWETLFDAYRYDQESGLYQVRYRYLHPRLGRWICRDREEYYDHPSMYVYCANRPMTNLDPYGSVVIVVPIICVCVGIGLTGCKRRGPKAPGFPNLSPNCAKNPDVKQSWLKLKQCRSDSGDGSAECTTICECLAQDQDIVADACWKKCTDAYDKLC